MKSIAIFLLVVFSSMAFAREPCTVTKRPGQSTMIRCNEHTYPRVEYVRVYTVATKVTVAQSETKLAPHVTVVMSPSHEYSILRQELNDRYKEYGGYREGQTFHKGTGYHGWYRAEDR